MLMPIKYQSTCIPVNKFVGLTAYNYACILCGMTLAERLKAARKFAGLTQKQLEEKSGVTQQTISNIEQGIQDKSTDVVKLAIACGVRAEWLSEGVGEMADGLYIHDEKLKRLFEICQQLPGYDVERLFQAGNALKKLNDKNVKP